MLKPMIDLPFQPITWGGEPHDFTAAAGGDHGRMLGLYTAETTQRYVCGTRSMTWDGRVFRYAKCGHRHINTNKFGVKNGTVLVSQKVTAAPNFAVAPQTAAIGDTQITVTFTIGKLGDSTSNNDTERTGVIAKNELCGGYISLYTGDYRQQRGIIGNTAVAAGDGSMIIYLDAPLHYALTALTSLCEILANPYGNVYRDSDQWTSVIGMPNVTAVNLQYLWLQTWGPLRISGTGALGAQKRERQFMFDAQGAVVPISGVLWLDASAGHDQQHAGFLIERTDSAEVANSAAPFIMLQINP